MILTAKQKQYVKVHGMRISMTAVALAIVGAIIAMLIYLGIRFARPEGWSDYFNTKFITTTMNLSYLYGSLITFILITGGYDALKATISFKTDEERKYSVVFLALLALCSTYLCSIGI
jgi:uncharacterized membrane protein YedE/YeeE